jgi:hypothetical protein
MALNIKDPEILQKIDHLSRVKHTSKVDVLRAALDAELEREMKKLSVRERLGPVLAKAAYLGTPSQMTWEDHKKASDADWGEE